MQPYPYNPDIYNVMIPRFVLQLPLHHSFLLTQWTQLLNYWSNKYLKHADDMPPVEIEYRIQFNLFFFIPNRNSKYRICYSKLTFNIGFKQPLVQIRFSCIEIFFSPLYIRIKPMLQSFILSLKQVSSFRFFFGIFLLNHTFTPNPYHLRI